MTGPTRKLIVIVAALVALVVAGGAGAIVRYTIFTIQTNNTAVLARTLVYCQHRSASKLHFFSCVVHVPHQLNPKPYIMYFTPHVIVVGRVSSSGQTKPVRNFLNP
jgi:hypothetical protein